MPTYAGGLSSQLMVAAETTVGSAVTVTTGYEMLGGETVSFLPTFLDGQGLKSGVGYKRGSRTALSRVSAGGDIPMEFGDRGHFGLLLKHATGSSITVPTQISTSTAYKQIHTPGPKTGLGLTVQMGQPETSDQVVKPFTYNGMKITDWEFSCNDNQIAQMKWTFDGWNETTATGLAAASYTSGVIPFSFADAGTFTIGGTATTAAGETTIGGSPTTVTTIVKGVTITCSTPMATDRYGLGNAGVKKEQFENAIPTITGKLDAEFTNLTDFYNTFKANTTTPLQLAFSHLDAGSSNPFLLSFILPAVRFKNAAVNVPGPDLLTQSVEFEGYDDGSGSNPVFQIKLVSTDTTL